MAYHNARLPWHIERGAKGGPQFFTAGIISPSGHSQRNQNWEDELAEWDISYGISRGAHIRAVIDHWFGRRGAAHSFPFRDWFDYKSGSQNNDDYTDIGIGDGVVDDDPTPGHRTGTSDWQLVKTYYDNINPYQKPIYKPDVETVEFTVNDVVTAVTSLGNGMFRFANANIPLLNDVIKAKYEYDIPCRYTSDKLAAELRYVNVASIPAINIIQVRPPNY